MKRDLDWFANRPTHSDFFDLQAGAAAFQGEWRKALDFNRRSMEISISQDRKENAAQSEGYYAFLEATFGRCQQAKERAARSMSLSRARISLSVAVLALALCNESQAQSLADELQKRFPKDTANIGVALPTIRAAMELNRDNTAQAIDLLRPASRFELGAFAGFPLTYIRGQIYLKQRSGKEAAAEFQKILDHRNIEPGSPLYPLAHLGLARAQALTGDTAQARQSYQNFLALWKDADQDLPVLQEAKAEYEKLK
jgi:tetratricopeptide (TPR) repeat protein